MGGPELAGGGLADPHPNGGGAPPIKLRHRSSLRRTVTVMVTFSLKESLLYTVYKPAFLGQFIDALKKHPHKGRSH